MKFTGERYVPGEHGQIRFEHLHRYALSLEFAAGKRVIDMASGEGYGAALLASVAKSVTGVDIDPQSVAHARQSYTRPNLSFVAAGCASVPLPDACVDVITSFETIEHHDQHEEMISEIKRLLRPGGVLIISSPNRRTYSDEPGYKNPFHVKELYFDEFHALLSRHFRHIKIYGPRLAAASFVGPLTDSDPRPAGYGALTGTGNEIVPGACALPSPIYFVALCSDDPAIANYESTSVYFDKSDDLLKQIEDEIQEQRVRDIRALQAQIEHQERAARLQQALAQYHEHAVQQQKERFEGELNRVLKNSEALLNRQIEETDRVRSAMSEELIKAKVEWMARMERQRRGFEKLLSDAESELAYRSKIANVLYNSRSWKIASRVHQIEESTQQWTEFENKLRHKLSLPPGNVFRGAVNEPEPGKAISDQIEVRGWAFSEAAPVGLVQVFVDNFFLGDLVYGLERPDVVEAFGGKAPLNCGYSGRVSLGGLKVQGEKVLKIRVYDQKGNRRISTQPVRLIPEPQEVFKGSLDFPRPGGVVNETIDILGWVYSTAAPIVLVQAFLGDRCIGALNHQVARTDVEQSVPEAPPLCGFGDRIPLTGLTAGGEQLLTIRVYDEKRNEKVFSHPVHILLLQPAADVDDDGEVREGDVESRALASPVTGLNYVIAEFQERTGREPTILDWTPERNLSDNFPLLPVCAPTTSQGPPDVLPYLDKTFDVVVLPGWALARIPEARRVASGAVVFTPDAQVEWMTSRVADRKFPPTSVIIPVFNKVSYTKSCLLQIQKTLPHSFEGEIIVVDDASSDETPAVVEEFARADRRFKLLRNAVNSGFIASCNRGADNAAGEVLVFLNNDTLPMRGWLPPLLRVLQEKPEAGAVGGKLIYPSGALQEAGAVIFSDGSGCNFGKGDPSADAPLYNFVREVDYCSGALLATPRALFKRLGGFDSRYTPAYYEDSDYCFSVRQAGRRVYYQPESVIVHFEGVTSGTDITAGVKSYQAVNRLKFVEKWAAVLKDQPSPPGRLDFATLSRLSVRATSPNGRNGHEE